MTQIRENYSEQCDFSSATELLTKSSLSLLEICKQCTPHLTVSQFIRQFRARYGVTPAQIRKEQKETSLSSVQLK